MHHSTCIESPKLCAHLLPQNGRDILHNDHQFSLGYAPCYWSEGYSSAYGGLVLEPVSGDDARLWTVNVCAMTSKDIRLAAMSSVFGALSWVWATP